MSLHAAPTLRTAATGLALSAVASAAALAQDEADATDPCEDGFLRVDLNEDGTVTEDEVQRAAEAAFAAYDADDSGEISAAEYAACRNALAGEPSRAADRTAASFLQTDADADGWIDRLEFLSAAAEARSAADSMARGAALNEMEMFVYVPAADTGTDVLGMGPEEVAARAAMTFDALDADADDRLSAEEWAEAETLKNDLSEVLNMEFEQADADASGTLDADEFASFHQWKREQAEARAREAGADTSAGAPVVHYRYDEAM
jgi:Ca2+-binding EF-hand superfamily protein